MRIPRSGEPATIGYAVNAAVSLVISALVYYGVPLDHIQVAALGTIATGVTAIAVAAMTRPIVVSAIGGAIGTILTAWGAFGPHLPADQIGAFVSAVSLALMLGLRTNVSPAVPGGGPAVAAGDGAAGQA